MHNYLYKKIFTTALVFCVIFSFFTLTSKIEAAVTFVAAGARTDNTGAITPALPAGIATNDILLLFLETANQAITVSNQAGGTWTEVTNSPQGTGTAGGTAATRLTVFWSRYNGTQTAPRTSDSGDHQIGTILAFRGVETVGVPFDVTAGSVETIADTTGAIPGATTTTPNTFVVAAISLALPDTNGTASFSAWANSDLTNVLERFDVSRSQGNGGSIGVATGNKTIAGIYGNTTVTTSNATKGMMSIALKPVDTTPPTGTITLGEGTTYWTANTSPTITLTTDDASQYQLCLNSATAGNNCTSVARAWATYSATPIPYDFISQGLKTLYVQFKDTVGNISATYSDNITIDSIPPTTPGTPSASTPIYDNTPPWNWTASTDSGSGLATPPYAVGWSLDSLFTTGVSSSTATTNSFTHSTALADGTWYFRVVAGDIAGNFSNFSSNGSVVIKNNETVTFNKNGGDTEANPTTKTTTYGNNIGTLPTPPIRAGYTFNSWNTQADGLGITFDETTVVTSDITVYAKWVQTTHILTINPSSGTGTGSYGGTPAGTIAHNTLVSITATSDASSNFTSWTATGAANSCNGSVVSPCAFNMTADALVTAVYTLKSFTLIYSAGLNGSITGTSPQTVNYGSDGTQVTAVANPGYHFSSWSDGVLTASRTDTNIHANLSVTANFEVNVIIPTKFVIVSATAGTIDLPSVVTIEAQDASGTLAGTYNQDVTLVTSGTTATGGGLINIVDGIGTTTISDTVVESVHLSLLDSELTGLNYSSTRDVNFGPGVTRTLMASSATSTMTAGTRLEFTVSRQDRLGNVVTSGSETYYLTSNGEDSEKKFYNSISGGSIITDVLISDGSSSATVWYYDTKVGTPTITISDASPADGLTGIDDATLGVTVTSATASAFILNNPGNLIAGERLHYEVSREDQFGNPSTNGDLTVYLYHTGEPSSVFFDADTGGTTIASILLPSGTTTGSFWFYGEKVGSVDVTVSDSSGGANGTDGINDASDNIIISPATTTMITLNDPGNMSVGGRLGYTVSRFDAYDNEVTSGDLTVGLSHNAVGTSTAFYDAATLGNIITSLNISGGTSSKNFWLYSNDLETFNVTASASGVSPAIDSVTVSAVPVVATRFVILNTPGAVVGDTATITVEVQDNSGNVDTATSTTLTLHTSGSTTVTPGGIINIENGVGTIGIIDTKVGTVNLSLEDTGFTGLNVSSTNTVNFTHGPTAKFTVTGVPIAVAGDRISYSITRQDQYENPVTSGVDTVYLYSDATSGTSNFYNAVSGGTEISSTDILDGADSATVWFSGTKVGSWNIYASDNPDHPGGIIITDGTSPISITSGATARLVLNDPGDMTEGTRLGYTGYRYDAYDNLVTAGDANYYLFSNANSTSTAFYLSGSGGTPETILRFTNGNSTAEFWYYEEKLGIWTIYLSDNPSGHDTAGITDGEDSVTVSSTAIHATKFIIAPVSNTATIGSPVTVAVRAVDASDNIDTTYQGDVTLRATGSATGGGLVDIINGVGEIILSNTVDETVTLSLHDTEGTGLGVSDTKTIVWSAAPPVLGGGGGFSAGALITPTIYFAGDAFPNADVQIAAVQNGVVPVGQFSKSGSNGSFATSYNGQLPSSANTFALVVYDKNQQIAQAKIFNLGKNTDLFRTLLLSPTIDLLQQTVTQGTFMGITGLAKPGNKIELMLDGKLASETTTADSFGNYTLTFNTFPLDLGVHTVRVRQANSQGLTSDYSIEKSFMLIKSFLPKADFNRDGQVDVQDLSVFIGRYASTTSPNREALDLNGDGKVDTQDLSLLISHLRQ